MQHFLFAEATWDNATFRFWWRLHKLFVASQVGLVVKNPPANSGDIRDMGFIAGLGKSPGGGRGNPLQYSFLENPMDSGIHGRSLAVYGS